jgi:hypothetical protein
MWARKIALKVYQQMQQEGVQPDSVTSVGVLNACASVMALEEGRCIHERIIQRGCESDAFVRKSPKVIQSGCESHACVRTILWFASSEFQSV